MLPKVELSQEETATLKKYRAESFKRLSQSKHRRKACMPEIAQIESIMWDCDCIFDPIVTQIRRDLRYNLLYDALAMWLDPVAGLAAYMPDMILEIAKGFLGEVRGV